MIQKDWSPKQDSQVTCRFETVASEDWGSETRM
jgi:hypothetical protein